MRRPSDVQVWGPVVSFGRLLFTRESVVWFERPLRHQWMFWPVVHIDFVAAVGELRLDERIFATIEIVICHDRFVFDRDHS